MNYNNIFKHSALALAVVAMCGCTNEVEYDPAAPMTNAQVFFASNSQSSFDLTEGQGSVTVEVSRVNTSGALTVDLTSSAVVINGSASEDTDIFTVPSSVSFADGSKTAPVNITFDFNEIKSETDYVVTLDLLGDELSEYGKTQQEVKIMYAPWSEWQTMKGECEYINGSPFGFADYLSIETRKSLLDNNKVQYRIPDLIANDYDILLNVDLSTNVVTVPVQETGYKNNGNMVMVCDTYTFYSEVAQGTPENYLGASFFDSETGKITINTAFYFIDGGIRWWGANYDYVQLPGYPNYNVTVSNAGTYISEQGQEFTILSAVKGSDVASYAIELYQGNLDEAAVKEKADAIVANTETVLYTDNRDFQFPVFEEDYYTCVTVSYDSEGISRGYNYYVFYNELNGFDWNEGWTTVAEKARFNDVFFAGLLVNGLYGWEVEVQKNDENPGIYRIVKPYANNIYDEEVERGHYYVVIDASNPDAVNVLPSYTSFGYYVLSSAPGKLVDGTKFVFPGSTLGVFNGYNEDGSFKVLTGWTEEAVLLDLAPEAAPETRSSSVSKRTADITKTSLIPYIGKKMERKTMEVVAR